MLDGCFQLAVGHLASRDHRLTALYLPLGIERIERFSRPGASFVCHVRMRGAEKPDSTVLTADLFLSDDQGALADIRGLSVKRADRSSFLRAARADLDPWLHTIAWKPAEPPARKSPAGTWLIVADESGLADRLAAKLSDAAQPVLVTTPSHSRDAWRDVLQPASQPWAGIAWLASLNSTNAACHRLYFSAAWVVGLQGVEEGEYVYNVTCLDISEGNAPALRVRIGKNFDTWTVDRIQ